MYDRRAVGMVPEWFREKIAVAGVGSDWDALAYVMSVLMVKGRDAEPSVIRLALYLLDRVEGKKPRIRLTSREKSVLCDLKRWLREKDGDGFVVADYWSERGKVWRLVSGAVAACLG